MERKVWIFAAVGFASALAIYGTSAAHAPASDNGRLNRLARLEALMDEGKVQYRPSFFRKKIQAHVVREQIAGLEPVKSVTEIAPPAVSKEDVAKVDAAKKAAEKKAADEKKKKDDAKKKKKKKKKSTDTDAATTTSDSAKIDDKKPTEPAGEMGGALNPFNGAYAGAAPNQNKNPETADEWFAYLANGPTFEKTSKFIQLKQVNTLKDDVFYPVVEKMLSTSATRLHEFAVMSLGSTPSLQSLEVLYLVGNEPSIEDQTKAQAAGYLKVYNRLDYVQILASAAGLPDNAALNNYAISMIRQTYAANLGAPTTQTPGATIMNRAPASNVVKTYVSVLATLRAVIASTPDANIRFSAEALASQLDAYLKG